MCIIIFSGLIFLFKCAPAHILLFLFYTRDANIPPICIKQFFIHLDILTSQPDIYIPNTKDNPSFRSALEIVIFTALWMIGSFILWAIEILFLISINNGFITAAALKFSCFRIHFSFF